VYSKNNSNNNKNIENAAGIDRIIIPRKFFKLPFIFLASCGNRSKNLLTDYLNGRFWLIEPPGAVARETLIRLFHPLNMFKTVCCKSTYGHAFRKLRITLTKKIQTPLKAEKGIVCFVIFGRDVTGKNTAGSFLQRRVYRRNENNFLGECVKFAAA